MAIAGNPSDRILMRAIAGANATTIGSDQVRAAADGLVGRPHDGTVDPVEATALDGIATDMHVSPAIHTGIAAAVTGTNFTVDIPAAPAGHSRIPRYLRMESLAFVRNEDNGAKTFADREGNRMRVWADTRSPTWLSAAFARRHHDIDRAKVMRLRSAEADALGLHLARQILAKSKDAIAPMPHEENVDRQLATTATTPSADNEHDLSDFVSWSPVNGEKAFLVLLADGTRAKLIASHDGKNVNMAYKIGPANDYSSPRVITARELASFTQTQGKHDVIAKLPGRYAPEAAILRLRTEAAQFGR